GLVERQDLWVTSKLWNDSHHPDHVGLALGKTLADLRLDFLDLYLIHWPVVQRHGTLLPESGDDFVPLSELPIAATWKALEAEVERGRCRHIGVSNFSAARVAGLLESAEIPPVINQVEMHPYLQQTGLLAACREHGVHLTAYSPLGSLDRPDRLKPADEPVLLDEPAIADIAAGHDATPAQVLLAWALLRGTSVIPKSVSPKRQAENLAAAELELTADDMERIAGLDRHRRYIDGTFWAMEGSPYTVEDLWSE
ncbi:MAG: aldo/keto reductase, partial [Holophagales bacterium]|nr:aldo/keto reductase [Holophagales bacterium]